VKNKFNLVDEPWIPIVNEGLVSIKDVFSNQSFKAIGGNPIEKISIIKLLLAIVQSAWTPDNYEQWKNITLDKLCEHVNKYLLVKHACFNLYGEKPFLQMPEIKKAEIKNYGALLPNIATGNTTVIFQSQVESILSDAEKALLLITVQNFAFAGKKTDNKVVLSKGYTGKSNEKGKPSSGKYGPSIGFKGFLHNFVNSNCLLKTLWINIFSKEEISNFTQFTNSVCMPPWEMMPEGEDCERAKELKNAYIGRLIPLSRFILYTDDGVHYSEGISYPDYSDGCFDMTTSIDFSKTKPRALWLETDKKPWRNLTALLSFLSVEKNQGFDCLQLTQTIPRAKTIIDELCIWSGGISVSSNAGEQYATGNNDYVQSEVNIKTEYLNSEWFARLRAEMDYLEHLSQILFACTKNYFSLVTNNSKEKQPPVARKAKEIFWENAETHFQNLIEACSNETTEDIRAIYWKLLVQIYNDLCPHDTVRQLDAWASCRPGLKKSEKTKN